ncbi:hypothetical protein NFC81_12560 [Salinispirillum sp. LH 10-3-1]|uniref:Uncharacterized protein n=1 Tax=Salinispirillum sp. LH 10-3-1 TaxID=2952525 RepID=A0AB38YE67_9GAMM
MRNPIVKLVIFLVIMAIILITLVSLEQRRRQPEFSPVFFSKAPDVQQSLERQSALPPQESLSLIA